MSCNLPNKAARKSKILEARFMYDLADKEH